MKKFMSALLAIGLVFTACQQEQFNEAAIGDGDAIVTVSLVSPDAALATRSLNSGASSAYGGLTNVSLSDYNLRYQLAIYSTDGEIVSDPTVVTKSDTEAASFSYALNTDSTYIFVAFADFVTAGSTADLHYNTADLAAITCLDSEDACLNDESRDAYFATYETTITASTDISLTLARPFAKLRVVTNDYDTAAEIPDAVTLSYYGCTRFTSLNALTGEVTGESLSDSGNTVYTGALSSDKEYSGGVDAEEAYRTLLVDYLLAEESEQTSIHFTFSSTASGSEILSVDLSTSVPIQRNYLTTVSGNLLSSDKVSVSVDVTISDDFISETEETVGGSSSEALITAASMDGYEGECTIVVTDPNDDSTTGTIVVNKSSSDIDSYLKTVTITVSDGASIQSDGLDSETGLVDLRYCPDVVVVAEDGETTTTYTTSIEVSGTVESGTYGSIYSLWGFQIYTDPNYGFTANANRSLAVIGDYLIVGNSSSVSGMLVFDRFTGDQLTDVSVNVDGIDTDRSIHAITNDDADHLLAATYTSATGYTTFLVYAWLNGISEAPTQILSEELTGDYFSALTSANSSVTSYDIGRTLSVIGDISSGTAILGTVCKSKYRVIIMPFSDGAASTSAAVVTYPNSSPSFNNASKLAFLSTGDVSAPEYVVSCGTSSLADYNAESSSNGGGIRFTAPSSHFWTSDIKGVDFIEFNGMRILGVQNGSSNVYHRLYVTNLPTTVTTTSLSDGFIFDSREGDSNGTSNISGSGYAVTGMTSYYSFTSSTVLGSNGNYTGDVCCALNYDGTAAQLYMVTTDQGMFAYEISLYE